MIIDADHVDSLDAEAALVIVGGGLCGLTLARELAAAGPVLVIESGGLGFNPAQHALQEGAIAGIPYPLTETRARGFGGSTGLWAGYCAHFDAHDFEVRDWASLSGWPFGLDVLLPYYRRASARLNLAGFDFDASKAMLESGIAWAGPPADAVPSLWRFGDPTLRLAEHELLHFQEESTPTVLVNAAVVDVRLDPARETVTELRLRTLDGREGRVQGRRFVLAAGGLETARLLLNAQVGSDWVGRCFMEHPHVSVPPFFARPDRDFAAYTARERDAAGREFTVCVGVDREVQKRERLLNARAHLYRTPQMDEHAPPRLGLFCEQQPHPDSRVTLTDDRDALGLRRLRLDWHLTDLDWASYERSAAIIGRTLAGLGFGTWNTEVDLCARESANVLHSNHHLGTTRMSADPGLGVVNPDARVHDVNNLYIAGGSVMPTSSWANPTLTVTALTLKLADHLRSQV